MSIYKPGRPSKYDPFTGKGSPPPSAPGEYRIRDAAGSIAYVGETNDLRRRMALHMTGKGAKYTRAHPPQALAGLWRCGGKTAAARLEYAVKTLPRARKLALLAAPEQVGEVFPALAGYDCAPVRDAALEQLLEGKYDG